MTGSIRRIRVLCRHLPGAAAATPAAAAAGATSPGRAQQPPHAPIEERVVFADSRRGAPCGPAGVLSDALCAAYVRDGFLLVSGLIAPPIAARALDRMWRTMDAENRADTWQGLPLAPRARPLDRRD